MKEYIERASLMGALTSGTEQLAMREMTGAEAYAEFVRLVNLVPATIVVPVVRCRECEYYDENGDCISLDLLIGIHSDTINYDFSPDPDFYCAYGRRKIETVLPKSEVKDESLEGYHEVS